jgi:hypothetical protein
VAGLWGALLPNWGGGVPVPPNEKLGATGEGAAAEAPKENEGAEGAGEPPKVEAGAEEPNVGGGAEGVVEETPKEKEEGVVVGVDWPEGAPKLKEGAAAGEGAAGVGAPKEKEGTLGAAVGACPKEGVEDEPKVEVEVLDEPKGLGAGWPKAGLADDDDWPKAGLEEEGWPKLIEGAVVEAEPKVEELDEPKGLLAGVGASGETEGAPNEKLGVVVDGEGAAVEDDPNPPELPKVDVELDPKGFDAGLGAVELEDPNKGVGVALLVEGAEGAPKLKEGAEGGAWGCCCWDRSGDSIMDAEPWEAERPFVGTGGAAGTPKENAGFETAGVDDPKSGAGVDAIRLAEEEGAPKEKDGAGTGGAALVDDEFPKENDEAGVGSEAASFFSSAGLAPNEKGLLGGVEEDGAEGGVGFEEDWPKLKGGAEEVGACWGAAEMISDEEGVGAVVDSAGLEAPKEKGFGASPPLAKLELEPNGLAAGVGARDLGSSAGLLLDNDDPLVPTPAKGFAAGAGGAAGTSLVGLPKE